MKRKHYLITGSSRGIGESLVKQLLSEENRIFCISRNQNPRLQVEAYTRGLRIHDLAYDLSDSSRIREVLREMFRVIKPQEVEAFYLINNAGTVHPIREIAGDEGLDNVYRNLNVNLVAPMIITDHVLRVTEDWGVERRVMNLSTGAARRPVHGWSAYCSAKAGLDMFSRCLAVEQKEKENGAKVVAFAPGVVDTEMQAEIREADEAAFPERQRFRELKEEGKLFAAEEVARTIIDILDRDDFGKETFLDIRELPWAK